MLANGLRPQGDRAGRKVANTTIKTTRVPDEIEAYNVSEDPLELKNLAGSSSPSVKAVLNQLETLLRQQCMAKRLQPQTGDVPGQLDCSENCSTRFASSV